jgi:prepilin-type N-terminal cleavage/methylation domain-containing protein
MRILHSRRTTIHSQHPCGCFSTCADVRLLRSRGFTLIELLIVIAIIGILATLVISSVRDARTAAIEAKARSELKHIADSLQLYADDHGGTLPDDVDRNVPPGLREYLSAGDWPQAPWPESVYDWDAWDASDLVHPPKKPVRQISIRFCDQGAPDTCRFPGEEWASGFEVNSSAYWCLRGPCRAHSNEPVDYPGYCMNCQ